MHNESKSNDVDNDNDNDNDDDVTLAKLASIQIMV